jgi:hypothetical protein
MPTAYPGLPDVIFRGGAVPAKNAALSLQVLIPMIRKSEWRT